MGARKQRSTLSALELLTTCVNTAQSGCIVSMLSLDLGGAFDNVSHERLLLHKGGDPDSASESDSIIDGFPIFGAIVRKCWDKGYQSIKELNLEVATKVKEAKGDNLDKDVALRVMETESSLRR